MDTLVICPKCESMNRVPLERAEQSQPICGKCKAELPLHEGVQDLSGASFKALIAKSSRPVIVDFWAPWCGPCRAFAPTFIQAARQMAGKAVFAKLNTEDFPQVSAEKGIRGIPTLAVYKNGIEMNRQSGALPLATLIQYLNHWV